MTALMQDSPAPPAPDTRSWSGRDRLRHWRGGLVVLAAIVVVAVAAVVSSARSSAHGTMDPRSYDPQGARALATLVRDRGVAVTRLEHLDDAVAAARPGTTVLVAVPAEESDLTPLRRLPAGTNLVLVDPSTADLEAVRLDASVAGNLAEQSQRLDCDERDAVVAGSVVTGGDSYAGPGTPCYAGIVYSQARPGGGTTVAVGSDRLLSNQLLGDEGNAALGLGLLSHGDRVLWLVPDPQPAATSAGTTTLDGLLPKRLGYAIDATVVAVALLMLWRVRRLGPVVAEPLPAVVRASETVEGLGRLYRAGRARGRAAAALRSAAVARLSGRLGLRADGDRTALISVVAGRTQRSAVAVTQLLYGPEPEDEISLVRLADELDALEAEVRRS